MTPRSHIVPAPDLDFGLSPDENFDFELML